MIKAKKSLRLFISLLQSSSQYVFLALGLLLGVVFSFGFSVHIGHLTRSFKSIYSVILLGCLLSNDSKGRSTVVNTVSFLIFNHHIFVFHCKHFPLSNINSLLSGFVLLDLGIGLYTQLGDRLFLGLLVFEGFLHQSLLLSSLLSLQVLLGLSASNLFRE
jgi:hypothetical protein